MNIFVITVYEVDVEIKIKFSAFRREVPDFSVPLLGVVEHNTVISLTITSLSDLELGRSPPYMPLRGRRMYPFTPPILVVDWG